ncbi:hypothetical protein UACE39S_03552 [Ureibacillus acetophenoni]
MIELQYFELKDFKQRMSGLIRLNCYFNGVVLSLEYLMAESQLEKYIEHTNHAYKAETFVYKVVDQESGSVIGHIFIRKD